MVTSTYGNAQAVEQRAHIQMMDVAHVEADDSIFHTGDSPPVIRFATHRGDSPQEVTQRAVDMHIGDGLQLLHAVAGEFLLVLLDGVKADGIDIFYRFCQSVGGHIVGCAGLKLKRQTLKGGLLPRHLVNHFSPTLIRRQLF